MNNMDKKILVRVAINGIVYWLDNLNGNCYTYSDSPARIGKAIKDPNDPKILHMELREDWKTVMTTELAKLSQA
jgi:hypothetical protein